MPGKFRVQIGAFGQVFEPGDLGFFTGRVGRRKVMFGLELAHGLSVLEPLAQRIDQDCIESVDAFTMLSEHLCGAGYGVVSQSAILSA